MRSSKDGSTRDTLPSAAVDAYGTTRGARGCSHLMSLPLKVAALTTPSPAHDTAKRAAAEAALTLIEDGMKLGLGTGSTAAIFVDLLGEKAVGRYENIICVPTSRATAQQAQRLGLTLGSLESVGQLDLTVDGADEVDPTLSLIKGGGGALLIEKIVASASTKMVVIADYGKQVETLGAFPLPIEITPFAAEITRSMILLLAAKFGSAAPEALLRRDGAEPFRTDEGNFVVDLKMQRIEHPLEFSTALNAIPGVVENGLFICMADIAIFGDSNGEVSLLASPSVTASDLA